MNAIKRILLFLISTLVAATSYSQSVGLVLSGGGAKGIAHIGVIQALEDNNIPIDFITGTSMGAIVGGLYASGYSTEEMMELLLSDGFSKWSTGQIDESLTYYFSKPKPTASILNIHFNFNDSIKTTANILPRSLINPLPMNFAFMELFAPYTAQCNGDFNKLFVPFRCVASNVYQKHKIIFGRGDLGDAIRASMSFPIVFAPIKIDGKYAFDGGIYDNFPIDVMREDFAPSFMIGINVSTGEDESANAEDNMINQIEAMIMQPQNDSIPPAEGMKIDINLSRFGLLDFPKARAIYKEGYDKAMSLMDSIKGRIGRRVPKETIELKRNIFKSQTPAIAFDSVSVNGGSKNQNEYIKFLFEKGRYTDTLNIEDAKVAYYRAISSGKLKDLIPHAEYKSSTKLFKLDLNAKVDENFAIGVGGYLTSSTNSMIYLSTKYKTLSFNAFDAQIDAWIGQSYYAGEFNAKYSLKTSIPSEINLQAVVTRQKYYESDVLFYEDDLPSFILQYDNYVRFKYGLALGRKAKLEFGLGYGYLRDRFYPSNVIDYSEREQDEARYKLGQIYAAIESSTLNSPNYPTSGYNYSIKLMGIYGEDKFIPESDKSKADAYHSHGWGQLEIEGSKYISISSDFTIGLKGNILASTKELYDDYTSSVVQAQAFAPTPSTQNYFNPAFRSNSYAAMGIIPIWKIMDNFQFRTEFYVFSPFRRIMEGADSKPYYSNWFDDYNFLGEAALVYNFSFGSLSLYGNYLSYPSKNWNFGISFGLLLPAQKFLR